MCETNYYFFKKDMAISVPVHSGKFLKKNFIKHLVKGHPYQVIGSLLKNCGTVTQIRYIRHMCRVENVKKLPYLKNQWLDR